MEKELVRKLGQQIGYGNIMQLAAECWEEMMLQNGYPTSGVFIPALKSDVGGISLKTWNERQLTIPVVSGSASKNELILKLVEIIKAEKGAEIKEYENTLLCGKGNITITINVE